MIDEWMRRRRKSCRDGGEKPDTYTFLEVFAGCLSRVQLRLFASPLAKAFPVSNETP